MSKIAVVGASGRVGSRVVRELVARGHQVTGIARNPDASTSAAGVVWRTADATDAGALAQAVAGHDVVISAMRFLGGPEADGLANAVCAAGVPRLVVVGGAGSLEIAPGVALVDTPDFPEAYQAEARAGLRFLEALRGVDDLDWTFLSPSAELEPGERTQRFRLGGDTLLVDAEGRSSISMEDYAIALVDEVEAPAHSRQRFTVGY